MIVACHQCQTRFKIADGKLKPEGIKVRCSKCKAVFQVFPEGAAPAVATPAAAESPALPPPEKPGEAVGGSDSGPEFQWSEISSGGSVVSSPFDAVTPSPVLPPLPTVGTPLPPLPEEPEAPREMYPELMPKEGFGPSPVAAEVAGAGEEQIGGTIDLEQNRPEESSLHLEQSTPGWPAPPPAPAPAVSSPVVPPAAAPLPPETRPARPSRRPARREAPDKLPVPEFSDAVELPPPTNRWLTLFLPLVMFVFLPFVCGWLYLASLGLPFSWDNLWYSLDRQVLRTPRGPLLVHLAFSRVDHLENTSLLAVSGQVYNPNPLEIDRLAVQFRAFGAGGVALGENRGELDAAEAGSGPGLLPGEDRPFYFLFPWPGQGVQRLQVVMSAEDGAKKSRR